MPTPGWPRPEAEGRPGVTQGAKPVRCDIVLGLRDADKYVFDVYTAKSR